MQNIIFSKNSNFLIFPPCAEFCYVIAKQGINSLFVIRFFPPVGYYNQARNQA